MAHTNSWDETYPPGSSQANTLKGSGILGNILKNVRERMDDLLGAGKFATDPIVGQFTGLKKIIPWQAGCPDQVTETWGRISPGIALIQMVGSTGLNQIRWNMPILLPVGCVITKIRAFGHRNNAGAGFSFITFRSGNTVADETNVHATITSASTAGLHYLDSGALSKTVDDASMLWSQITLNPNVGFSEVGFAWLEVTYNLPATAPIACIGG